MTGRYPRLLQQTITRDGAGRYLPHWPWRMLVGCAMLNLTTREQAEPVLLELFDRWPDPQALAAADSGQLERVLRPTGLHRRRAATLKRMSAALAAGHTGPVGLFGCGGYARDSWAIFALGRRDLSPADRELAAWLEANRA